MDYTTNDINPEVQKATAQATKEELRAQLGQLIAESPSRQRALFIPDFTDTKEYRELLSVDTSSMSAREVEERNKKLTHIKRYGTFTDEQRQLEIDGSLAMPLSESFKALDKLGAEIEELEAKIRNFDTSTAQAKADELEAQLRKQGTGANRATRARLQAEYDKGVDEIEAEYITKPLNALKVQRYTLVEKYKVYDSRIKLYVSTNREAIDRAIAKARDEEITENLLALAEYMEG